MTISKQTSTQSQSARRQPNRRRRPRRSSRQAPLASQVNFFFLVLVLSILAKIILMMVDVVLGFLGSIVVHLYAGYRLNRRILIHVKWHPHHNTIHNIASVKLSSLILWPWTYPVFFFKLWVVRYL